MRSLVEGAITKRKVAKKRSLHGALADSAEDRADQSAPGLIPLARRREQQVGGKLTLAFSSDDVAQGRSACVARAMGENSTERCQSWHKD
ncbi:MAG: hypothetical protein C4334_07980 [Pyrinomonas sp.]